MAVLAGAVADLVRSATTEADPRRLRGNVEKVLGAFGGARSDARAAAVSAIGKALRKATGPGAQVLALAIGALVEAGAPAALAWPALSKDLVRLLAQASAFAAAALKRAKTHDVDVALEKAAALAKTDPAGAAAWSSLPSRCLAAVACLTRDKNVRTKARADEALLEAAWPLGDAIAEVGYLVQALRILDGASLIVLAPGVGRGWRVEVDAMPSNAELYILLADIVTKEAGPAKTFGPRPEPGALNAICQGTSPKRFVSTTIRFRLSAWTALSAEGSLETPGDDDEHTLVPDGLPADIPAFGDERVVFVQAAPPFSIPVSPSFEGLGSRVDITAELSSADVVRAMVKMASARAPAPRPKSAKSPKSPKQATKRKKR